MALDREPKAYEAIDEDTFSELASTVDTLISSSHTSATDDDEM